MKTYCVEYWLDGVYQDVKEVQVEANSKVGAYYKAVYEIIPALEGSIPWSAWVSAVWYKNGKKRDFGNTSGNPY